MVAQNGCLIGRSGGVGCGDSVAEDRVGVGGGKGASISKNAVGADEGIRQRGAVDECTVADGGNARSTSVHRGVGVATAHHQLPTLIKQKRISNLRGHSERSLDLITISPCHEQDIASHRSSKTDTTPAGRGG